MSMICVYQEYLRYLKFEQGIPELKNFLKIFLKVFLFQRFVSNRPFISNHGQLIKKSDRRNILSRTKIFLLTF